MKKLVSLVYHWHLQYLHFPLGHSRRKIRRHRSSVSDTASRDPGAGKTASGGTRAGIWRLPYLMITFSRILLLKVVILTQTTSSISVSGEF